MPHPALVQLSIKGMTCQGCVNSVTKIVKRADPDADVSVDLASGRLAAKTISSVDTLVALISKAGYPAQPA